MAVRDLTYFFIWIRSILFQTPNTLSINVQQISCVSKQWNIENLSLISQSKEKKISKYKIFWYSLDSIRYGENLSLLFKCIHRVNQGDSLQMKHIYLSNDETMKDKYVCSEDIRFKLEWLFSFFRRLILVKILSVIFFVILYRISIQYNQQVVINLRIYYLYLHYHLFFFGK